MDNDRIICYTLDLEHDYAGVSPEEQYETFSSNELLARFASILNDYQIQLTIFVTGIVLDQKPDIVNFFLDLDAEFELHGYDHNLNKLDYANEIHKGIQSYYKRFGKDPIGYRSPGGVISPQLFDKLESVGIKYDSSIAPSFRLGFYNNLSSPSEPHLLPDSSIIEFPMGVVPKIRMMVAASYIRLFGLPFYRMLFSLFGRPSPLIYLFHLVDVIPVKMRTRLDPFLRSAYAVREDRGMEYFAETVRYFKESGYQSIPMTRLYARYTRIWSDRLAGIAD